MSDPKELKKGSMKRLHPFNPSTTHPTTKMKVTEWQNDSRKESRNTLPPMDPDAKARAIHKLGAETQVRKNPDTGEREFLLHRGHSQDEGQANQAGDGNNYYYKNDKSSWTPNYKIAHGFAKIYGNKEPLVSSAWIKESAIHHIPRQLGHINPYAASRTKQGQGPNDHANEYEIVVNPGHLLPKAGAGHIEQAKNESFHGVPTLEERVRARIGNKKVQDQGVYVPSYMKKSQEFGELAKEFLAKGAMRRLAPYNPRDPKISDYRKDLDSWQQGPVGDEEDADLGDLRNNIASDYVNRSQLPSEKARALHKLSSLTKVRLNANGEREFLLHRGMDSHETKTSKKGNHITHSEASSWSPDRSIAYFFAQNYNPWQGPTDKTPERPDDNVASAWINEKHIASVPHQVTGTKAYKHEREVIVAPHTSEIANTKNETGSLNRKINDRVSPFQKPKLAKAVPAKRIDQAEGKDWDREKKPRHAAYDFSKLQNVTTRRLAPGLYHHTGTHGNLTFHTLTRGSKPNGQRGLASMATGTVGGKEYLLDAHRAHGLDRGKGYVQRLWDEIQGKYPDIGIARTDATRAKVKYWEDHHPDIYHDLVPDVPVKHLDSGIAGASIVSKDDINPSAVVKPPLNDKIINDYKGNVPEKHAHFLDPNFGSSHREAMYHLLANEVFKLGNFVPRTTVFKHPVTGRPTSAMEYVPKPRQYSEVSQLQHTERSGDLHKLAIMDMVMGNNDRHRKNLILDQYGEPKLIDHGLAFDYGNMSKTPVPVYAEHLLNQQTPQKVHKWIEGLNPTKLRDTMVARGAPEHIADIASKRLNAVKDWSAGNSRNDSISQGKLSGAYGKTQAYRLGVDDSTMDQEARAADQGTLGGSK